MSKVTDRILAEIDAHVEMHDRFERANEREDDVSHAMQGLSHNIRRIIREEEPPISLYVNEAIPLGVGVIANGEEHHAITFHEENHEPLMIVEPREEGTYIVSDCATCKSYHENDHEEDLVSMRSDAEDTARAKAAMPFYAKNFIPADPMTASSCYHVCYSDGKCRSYHKHNYCKCITGEMCSKERR